jgi:hypothetical protein
MLRQPAFVAAEFHTEFLDELLQRRGNEGFSDVDPSLEEVAALAACIAEAEQESVGRWDVPRSEEHVGTVLLDRPGSDRVDGLASPASPTRVRTWKGQARREARRG